MRWWLNCVWLMCFCQKLWDLSPTALLGFVLAAKENLQNFIVIRDRPPSDLRRCYAHRIFRLVLTAVPCCLLFAYPCSILTRLRASARFARMMISDLHCLIWQESTHFMRSINFLQRGHIFFAEGAPTLAPALID